MDDTVKSTVAWDDPLHLSRTKAEDVAAVVLRQARNSQTVQKIVGRSPSSAHRDRGGFQVEYIDKMTRREGSALHAGGNPKSSSKSCSRSTQAVPNSADEGKDNRADRRRLRLLVSISTFGSMAFGRPVKTDIVDLKSTVCHQSCKPLWDLKTKWIS